MYDKHAALNMPSFSNQSEISRRRAILMLASFGITGPASMYLSAQDERITLDNLKSVARAFGLELDAVQLSEVIKDTNEFIEKFQVIRNYDFNDFIEPVLVFTGFTESDLK